MDGARETVHATAIAFDNRAALIRGPSGSGKSDLALRCIMYPSTPLVASPVALVGDDRVILERHGSIIHVSPHENLKGMIELRGLGIYHLPHEQSRVPVSLVVDLLPREDIERFPDEMEDTELLGLRIPLIKICAYDASAACKLLFVLSGKRRHSDDPQ